MMKVSDTLGPEGLSKRSLKAMETMGVEGRRQRSINSNAAMTVEQRSARAKKVNDSLGVEGRRAAKMKAMVTLGEEGLKAKAAKAWETRAKNNPRPFPSGITQHKSTKMFHVNLVRSEFGSSKYIGCTKTLEEAIKKLDDYRQQNPPQT